MKKIKGARWAWWSPASPRDEMPSMESLTTSNGRGGTGKAAVSEGVGNAEGAEADVGPPRGGGRALTKSRSQGGRGEHADAATGVPTGGATAGFVEGRRSVSHVEAHAAWVAASLGVKVIAADMPALMQVHAFRCARRSYDGLHKFSSRQMAHDIKKEFDKVYGPVWHCVIGSSFGSFVTHSTGCFLCFSMEKLLVLVFKTRIPRTTT